MPTQHVVVDGSNIATEGRSTPSLEQLESAVAELRREMPDAEVTVVVDATFAHRIDPSELERFEAASLRGEYVSPPAGAIGRGDAFLLRIAEKVDGIALSNDSFQEFHGEHAWLFDRGRLLGATPVPGVGWIFVPRIPVRGPRSRVAVRDASRAKERVEKAIAVATREVVEPEGPSETGRRSRRSRVAPATPPKAVNDPMTFITFIAEHPLGAELEGEVESFTSHGATVRIGDLLGYAPLSGLGDPPPRSARSVLHHGDRRSFVVTALDPFRRGVELALPGIGTVSGRPSDEMVAAEVKLTRPPRKVTPAPTKAPRRRRSDPPISETEGTPAPTVSRRRTKTAAASDVASPPVSASKTSPRRRTSKETGVELPSAAMPESQSSVTATRAPAKKVGATRKAPARVVPAAEDGRASAKKTTTEPVPAGPRKKRAATKIGTSRSTVPTKRPTRRVADPAT